MIDILFVAYYYPKQPASPRKGKLITPATYFVLVSTPFDFDLQLPQQGGCVVVVVVIVLMMLMLMMFD